MQRLGYAELEDRSNTCGSEASRRLELVGGSKI